MANIVLLRDFQASQFEFWLPTRYLGYDVSSFGRIRSYWNRIGGGRMVLGARTKILKESVATKGYLRVSLTRRVGPVRIHRLVALAFIPNPEGLSDVNHKTALKSDNRIENLEWVTRSGNNIHGWQNGLFDNIRRRAHAAG